MKLWTINRWLRWTGFRLYVEVGDNTPTRIGILFGGFPGTARWRRWEGNRQIGASL